jgi:hypothetical protein
VRKVSKIKPIPAKSAFCGQFSCQPLRRRRTLRVDEAEADRFREPVLLGAAGVLAAARRLLLCLGEDFFCAIPKSFRRHLIMLAQMFPRKRL